MPLQNRVDPYGALVATPERGTLMGNRGYLHDGHRRIRHPRGWQTGQLRWTTTAWIACRLEFKGRHRQVMQPGLYTELFFLDEATALAAGHRPCAECRRDDYLDFRQAWAVGVGATDAARVRAGAIDACLQRERLTHDRQKRTYADLIEHLPDGVLVVTEPAARPSLILGDRWLPWSFGGYGPPQPRPTGRVVTVLTPRSIVAALAGGYRPQLHSSAQA